MGLQKGYAPSDDPATLTDAQRSALSHDPFVRACEATGYFLDLAENYAGKAQRSTRLMALVRAGTKYGRAVELALPGEATEALERLEGRLIRLTRRLLPHARFWDRKWCLESWKTERRAAS